jgi:cold shock CspA family protein
MALPKQQGIIVNFSFKKGYGYIEAKRGDKIEYFFLHTANVQKGIDYLGVGAEVLFYIGAPRKEGQYPVALNIEVLRTHIYPMPGITAGAEALAEGGAN